MAEAEEKTFKVICGHCGEPFTVRFPLAAPDAGGETEVVVTCQYCSQPVVVQIPSKYVPEDHLFRGLKSVPKAT